MYSHLIEAKRSAARCAPDASGLHPRMHRRLVEAVRSGCQVAESVIVSGLTDKAAYRLESRIIGEFHKYRAGQLWNTIDERFMDPRSLPDEWNDPEHPLYKLPRPLVLSSIERSGSLAMLAACARLQRRRTAAFAVLRSRVGLANRWLERCIMRTKNKRNADSIWVPLA
jgi:hypothetical protein